MNATLNEVAEAIEQGKQSIQTAYWELVRQCAEDGHTTDPGEVAEFIERNNLDFEQFQKDVERQHTRREALAKLAEEPKLRAKLDGLEAEHRAELERYREYEAKHVATCQRIYDDKEVIRAKLVKFDELRQQVRELAPGAEEARQRDTEIGRQLLKVEDRRRYLTDARQFVESEIRAAKDASRKAYEEGRLAVTTKELEHLDKEAEQLRQRREAIEAELLK